ncbi:MAG: GRAS family protein [Salinivirgaceae bacterium]
MLNFPIPEVKETLETVMRYYPDNINPQTATEIEVLLDHCLEGLEDHSDKMLATLLIKALKKHIGPVGTDEHIYLKKFDLPQIKLFDLIIKHFPFVRLAHDVVNATIVSEMRKVRSATLIDFGIGRGIQTQAMLEMLQNDPASKLEVLTIIGVEPFTDALAVAEQLVNDRNKSVPFDIHFIPLNMLVEQVDFDEIQALIPVDNEFLAVNESLTLHHVQSSNIRNDLMLKIAQLHPQQFLLTEPNIDHFEPDFHKRFQNCYRHFYHVFAVIDKLDIAKDERNGLKLFFGREIDDIIGKQFQDRYERHEPADMWLWRLRKAGFAVSERFVLPEALHQTKAISARWQEQGYLGFSHADETVLALIYATTHDAFKKSEE